jgi:D-arabinose 1-dehydrogenase-like Zn-dependent alcohol dehydrogenase
LKRLGDPMVRERTIVLIGAGGLGLMCLTLMQALGAKGAVVADIDTGKREAALAAGARAAVDAAAPDALQQLQAAAGEPIAGVIDFVGASNTARLGIDALARGGKYVIVGLFGGEVALSLPLLPMRALTVQGSYVGTLAELEALMALVASGRVPPIPVTEHRLDQANEVLTALKAGRVLGRAVLTP